ncbi:MAG TPA: DUF4349 domain-containing protein [Kribbellaceae bacterium]|nr:DUF4349 domain-containing protein [Kribbellaceae bacterium]
MSRTRIAAAAAALLTAAIVMSGCVGSDGAESSGAPAPAAGDATDGRAAPDAKSGSGEGKAGGGAQQPTLERAIIRTGFLTVEAGDVLQVRQRVTEIATGARGQVASEETGTDPDGQVNRAHLVVRVPTASYDATMRALSQLGPVKEIRQESADVTEQVVDVNSRVATQRAGLARMRALLARANTIGEVVSVETELTRREGELEALLAKQKSLASQTELATLTVTLVRPGEAPAPEDPERGFLHGLSDGWNAFTTTTSVLLTAVGALLPFLVAIALVTVPVTLLVRRFRRTPQPAPVQPD